MPTVETFTRAMIEKYLRSSNYRYLKDSDEDYQIQFADNGKRGCELTFWFMAAGPQKHVYDITASSNKRIPKNEWGKAMLICNTWNKERRWPKAYLHIQTDSDSGYVRLEMQVDLEKGIHQELLDDISDDMLAASDTFWEWAHGEQGL